MKWRGRAAGVAGLVLLWGAAGGQNLVSNGDFMAGTAAWELVGAVFGTGAQGLLTDATGGRSLLYQGVALGSGPYAVAFDFRNLLSAAEPFGFARDTFFASLYFSGTPGLFDPLGPTGFSQAVALLDVDAVQATVHTGLVAPSPFGGGFQRYTGGFSLAAPATVFVVFDLVGLNGIASDSVVAVDNVSVVLVPEPVAVVPLAVAGGLLALRRRRRV